MKSRMNHSDCLIDRPNPPRRFSSIRAFTRRSLLIIAVLAAAAPTFLSAGAKFSGVVGYRFAKDSSAVTLKAEAVKNTSSENATGTLMIKIWAFDAPFDGKKTSGVPLGSCKLDGLNGGQQYNNLVKSVPLTLPKAKRKYFICMTLVEYKNNGYVVVDWRNMTEPQLLGPLPQISLTGPWSARHSYEGGTVDINVGKISHRRAGPTGTLKLALWATRQPYNGGKLTGFEIGEVRKKALATGLVYNNVKNTAKFTPPPNGTYYMTLTLSEFRDEGYVIVSHLPAAKQTRFDNGKD